MRRPHLLLCALLASLLLNFTGATFAGEKSRRPNIIFFIADDLGYGELGSYGQKKIKTPNLDRLAASGMRFTQHYSGNAVCAPSRCVLMTGKHPGHAIVRDNFFTPPEGQFPLPPNTATLARLLKSLGYTTGAYGKWGLGGPGSTGEPSKQGIDRFFGYLCQGKAHNFYPPYLWNNERKVELKNPVMKLPDKLPPDADPNDPANYKRYLGKEYSSDLIFAEAQRFVRDNKDRPFFLFVPTTVPHLSLQVPEDSLAEYKGLWEDPPYVGGNGYLPTFAPRATYAAMVTRLDREVGKLLALVRELGLEDDTIVIFTSDNGPLDNRYAGTDSLFFFSTAGLRGFKGSLFEGGIRVPLLISWKGRIAPGSVSDRVTGFEDWLPTLLTLVSGEQAIPPDLDGISFAPTLLGKKQDARPFLYREFPSYGGQQSVRVGDWVGLRQKIKPKDKSEPNMSVQLYNLRDDLAQTKNVAATHPDVVATIERLMREQHTPSKDFPFPALDRNP